MRGGRRPSIRGRLVRVILSITVSALAAGFAVVVWNDVRVFRTEMVNQMVGLAQVTADFAVSELAFRNRDEAARTLARLDTIPELESAVVLDAEGKVFATFAPSGDVQTELPFEHAGHSFESEHLRVVQPVEHDGERLGTLFLTASTRGLRHKIRRYLRTMVVVMLALIALSLLAAFKLQEIISGPILRLAAVARAISESGDYSKRVSYRGSDEVSTLYQAWNDMLDQIQRRQRERARAEAALRTSEERFRSIIESSNDAIYVLGMDDRFMYVNPRFEELLEVTLAEATAPEYDNLALVAPASRELIRGIRRRRARNEEHPTQYELQCTSRSGRVFEFEANTTVIEWDGEPARLGLLRDITRRKQMESELQDNAARLERYAAELERSAFFDLLTGLPNRALFVDRLERAMERSRRHADDRFAVLFLDLDRFKLVNDSLGHHRGDQLLVAAAARLKQCVRTEDTVARFGGDEFAVLVEGARELPEVTHVAERIQAEFAQPFELADREVYSTASIGIALSSANRTEPGHYLRDSDTAMYRAKARGGASFQVFDERMHVQAMSMLQLEAELRRAVERDQMRLQYQPVVNLASGRVAGFEALVRWQHPRRGLINPRDFLEAAEETGVIQVIDSWVLQQVLRQLEEWRTAHGPDAPARVSINVSGRKLAERRLVDEILAAGARGDHDGRCRDLTVEITETVLMEHLDTAAETLAQLKSLGVGVSVDDFGTGYSSLSYLQRLPIDTLKIDRSFVSGFPAEEASPEIVRAIVGLAHNLGLQVVAEGVESREQYAELGQLGCDFAQGFWLAEPLDADAASRLVAGHGGWN